MRWPVRRANARNVSTRILFAVAILPFQRSVDLTKHWLATETTIRNGDHKRGHAKRMCCSKVKIYFQKKLRHPHVIYACRHTQICVGRPPSRGGRERTLVTRSPVIATFVRFGPEFFFRRYLNCIIVNCLY